MRLHRRSYDPLPQPHLLYVRGCSRCTTQYCVRTSSMNLQLLCKVIRSRVSLPVVCPQLQEMLAQQQRRTVCHEAFSNLRPVERLDLYAVKYCLRWQVRSLECAFSFYICQKVDRQLQARHTYQTWSHCGLRIKLLCLLSMATQHLLLTFRFKDHNNPKDSSSQVLGSANTR